MVQNAQAEKPPMQKWQIRSALFVPVKLRALRTDFFHQFYFL
jgi:hypothetical protein